MAFDDALAHDFVGPHAESSPWSLMTQAAQATQAAGRRPADRAANPGQQLRMHVPAGREARMGVAPLPERVIEPRLAGRRVRLVQLEDGRARRRIVIVTRTSTATCRR